MKNFNIVLDKSVVDTADRLRGELPRNKYIQEALKSYNRRIAAKKSVPKLEVTTEDLNEMTEAETGTIAP